jgi:hypothetical protein
LFIIFGNWMAKLPPLRAWRPAGLSLDMAGEAAMLRFGGSLLVPYGLIIFATALLIPTSLLAPLVGLLSIGLLVIVIGKRRQLHNALTPG